MGWKMDDDNHDSSLSVEEVNSGGNIVGNNVLKKGPWTEEEDEILTEYVRKNGEGNWNAVQKFSGLSRCGKSCRLRWANHLRPDLKKGAFTPEEEATIIRLHAKLGNKWARMAAELPGRTDNEIKNFWNTRSKRLTRAGIKIYPDDVLNHNDSNELQQSQVSGTFSNELHSSHNSMETGILGIPVFKIEHSIHSELYSSKFHGVPNNNVVPQDPIPSFNIYHPAPSMRPRKRLRGPEAPYGLCDTATSSPVTQWHCNDAPFQHHQPNGLPPFPGSYYGNNSSLQGLPGSHAFINGTHSTSNPNYGSMKLELPSLQSSESDYSFWDAPTLIQSPQVRPSQFQGTPDTDGLLESIVLPPNKVETDPTETSTINELDELLKGISDSDWDNIFRDSVPSLSSSTAAILSDPLNYMSNDNLQPTDAMLVVPQARTSDADPSSLTSDIISSNQNHNDDSYQLDSLRPDSWLNANLLSPETEVGKDYLFLQETISALQDDTHHLYQQPRQQRHHQPHQQPHHQPHHQPYHQPHQQPHHQPHQQPHHQPHQQPHHQPHQQPHQQPHHQL